MYKRQTLDYVVTKVPRFTFEKFPQAEDRLTTQMKSVGEVMAIGRTFKESFQKALRGLETGVSGLGSTNFKEGSVPSEDLRREISTPGAHRIWFVAESFRQGLTIEEVFSLSGIDPWFLSEIEELVKIEIALVSSERLETLSKEELFRFCLLYTSPSPRD